MDHLTCEICDRPLNKGKKFCSLECKGLAERKSRLILTCKHCGKEFWLHPSVAKRRPTDFCNVKCAIAFSEIEVQRLRSQGLPLIEVFDDYCLCKICGETLKVPGSHLKTHGVRTFGMGHLERNLVLGLGLGERALPKTVLDIMSARAKISNFGESRHTGGHTDVDYFKLASLRLGFPIPQAVKEACVKNAHEAHERACERGSKRSLQKRALRDNRVCPDPPPELSAPNVQCAENGGPSKTVR